MVEDPAETDDVVEVDCMTQEEARHFLKVSKEHYTTLYPIFLTALRSAVRQGEIVALAWDAVDWHSSFITIKRAATNGEIHSTKNRKRRRLPMSPHLAEVLKDHRRRAGEAALASGKPMSRWIFPSPTGGLMDPSKIRREFKAVLTKAKIRGLTFHSLRHTALTTMAENVVPMAAFQRIAGHSSIQVTGQYYLHAKPEAHKGTIRALEALDDADPGSGSDASKMQVASADVSESQVSH